MMTLQLVGAVPSMETTGRAGNFIHFEETPIDQHDNDAALNNATMATREADQCSGWVRELS
jgi:hypothetical protein